MGTKYVPNSHRSWTARMNRTVIQLSNYSRPLGAFSTLSWDEECWEWVLEQIILLTFRKLTHSVPISVFVDEKGVTREERDSSDTKKASGAVVKAWTSRVFQ